MISLHIALQQPFGIDAAKDRELSVSKTVTDHSSEYHAPVLVDEVIELLRPKDGKWFFDGTLGGGGHTAALLAKGASVIGNDQDPEALAFAGKRLANAGPRFRAVLGSFSDVGATLDSLGISQVDGALLDLGVSSHQLDCAERGFSFNHDGALDMRMSPSLPLTAADLVNQWTEDDLRRIFRELGEEPEARRMARAIVQERERKAFTRTLELANLIEKVSPRRGRRTHPATKVFQALRMAVNQELERLAAGLAEITARLKPGARFGVISFHSGEDRLVKEFFRHCSTEFVDRPEWPEARANPEYLFRAITRKPVIASAEETERNPRSRSAKLRVVERLAVAAKRI